MHEQSHETNPDDQSLRPEGGGDTAPAGDGFPPVPDTADYETLRRYACVRVLANTLRLEEEYEAALFFGRGPGQPRAGGPEVWARAEQLYDQMLAESAAAEQAESAAGADPTIAWMDAAFAAAQEACRTGHEAGCTYGGLTPTGGYWLGTEGCTGEHGERCQLRGECEGADAEARFTGWGGDWIWAVTACMPCANAYAAAHPEWRGGGEDG